MFIPPIQIHPIILIFIIISLLTGSFLHLLIIFLIVLIHEFGHYIAARIFQWKISHIKLWIFGGVLVTEEYTDRPLREQLIVTLAGPAQHLLLYAIIFLCSLGNVFSESVLQLMLSYNTIILIFNFLPIWPLDGGRILFVLLCSILPYRLAYSRTIIVSIIVATLLFFVQLFFYSFTLSALLIMVYLILENISEWKQRFYIFMRFLFQRYYGDPIIKRNSFLIVPENMKLIDVLSNFMLGKKYIIKIQYQNKRHKEITEKKCLEKFFIDSLSHEKIGNIPM